MRTTKTQEKNMKKALGLAAAAVYIGVVVLANILSSRLGMVGIGFGLTASAGTYAAGAALGFKDAVREGLGPWAMLVVIGIGSALSFWLASPEIAGASLAAFATSEFLDSVVYEPIRRTHKLVAVLVSNTVGAVVDTYVFLKLAPFGPVTFKAMEGQLVGKILWATIVPVLLIALVRHYARFPRPSTKVYLAGPILGCDDSEAHDWRDRATELLDGDVLNPMARDYRGREAGAEAEIVEGDKADIVNCGAVIAYCDRPSVGTSMEIHFAWLLKLPVVVVVPEGQPVSPWLVYHSAAVVHTVEDAVKCLRVAA